MGNARGTIARAALLSALAACASGQPPDQALRFEVASARVEDPSTQPGGRRGMGVTGGPGSPDPTRIRFENLSLGSLIVYAFDVADYQVEAPGWARETRYLIVAKVPPAASRNEVRIMLQELLRDRFELKLHHVTKQMAVHTLTVAKAAAAKGPPALLGTVPDVAPRNDGDRVSVDIGGVRLRAGVSTMGIDGNRAALQSHNEPISWLARLLGGQLGGPVVDDTGLTGTYSFRMWWIPSPPGSELPADADPGGPDLRQALEAQLGLKIGTRKGPVDILVVDHALKVPSDN